MDYDFPFQPGCVARKVIFLTSINRREEQCKQNPKAQRSIVNKRRESWKEYNRCSRIKKAGCFGRDKRDKEINMFITGGMAEIRRETNKERDRLYRHKQPVGKGKGEKQ